MSDEEHYDVCPDCGGLLSQIDTIVHKITQEVVSEVFSCEDCEGLFSDRGNGLESGDPYGFY